jgi:hypothetical protein
MKIVQNNSDLEVGKWYWCRSKDTGLITIKLVQLSYEKYIGNHIWCFDGNNQGLDKYTIVGPIEEPYWDDFKGNR